MPPPGWGAPGGAAGAVPFLPALSGLTSLLLLLRGDVAQVSLSLCLPCKGCSGRREAPRTRSALPAIPAATLKLSLYLLLAFLGEGRGLRAGWGRCHCRHLAAVTPGERGEGAGPVPGQVPSGRGRREAPPPLFSPDLSVSLRGTCPPWKGKLPHLQQPRPCSKRPLGPAPFPRPRA